MRRTDDLDALDEIALFRRDRELLARAYGDFVVSTPAREKVFRVFETAVGRRSVPLSRLRDSLAERRGSLA